MPVFIEIGPDPFAEKFLQKSAEAQVAKLAPSGQDANKFTHVRRPHRGIQIKEDTYATIEIRGANGDPIQLVDGGGRTKSADGRGTTTRYSNFIMQSVQESRAEKVQIVETFGEWFAFFFGERPRTLSVSGILVNSEDFNWRAEFWENYDRYLRGTRCVINRTRLYLSWDDIIVEGYMTGANAQDQAQQPHLIPFTFSLLLTNYINISNIGSPDFPVPFGVKLESVGTSVEGSLTETAAAQLAAATITAPGQFGTPSSLATRRTLISDNLDEYVGMTESRVKIPSLDRETQTPVDPSFSNIIDKLESRFNIKDRAVNLAIRVGNFDTKKLSNRVIILNKISRSIDAASGLLDASLETSVKRRTG